jgi:hypothetical protein
VVVHGVAHRVTDPTEKQVALDALVEHTIPGRSHDVRPADARELAATAVVRVDLTEVSAKSRTGGANDDTEDLGLPHWAGVLLLRTGYDAPVPNTDLDPTTAVPHYLAAIHAR